MLKLLFIDDTDTSLAPLISGIFALEAKSAGVSDSIQISTAGCFAGINSRPLERRIAKLAQEKGISLPEHSSQTLKVQDIESNDLLVVMNEANFWHIKDLSPEVDGNKVRLLMEFTEQLGLREMPDPVQGQIDFLEAFTILEKSSKPLLSFIISTYDLASDIK